MEDAYAGIFPTILTANPHLLQTAIVPIAVLQLELRIPLFVLSNQIYWQLTGKLKPSNIYLIAATQWPNISAQIVGHSYLGKIQRERVW